MRALLWVAACMSVAGCGGAAVGSGTPHGAADVTPMQSASADEPRVETAPTPPACELINAATDAESCALGEVTFGDLTGDDQPEWIAELRIRIGGRERTEWHVLRFEEGRFITMNTLYDAEGFTPGESAGLRIHERRIIARGAWDCADCGCTEGVIAIALSATQTEPQLVIDRATTQIVSEPPVCDGP